jgi:hypothetical protein
MPAQNAGKPDRWTVVQKWTQADFPGPKATEGYLDSPWAGASSGVEMKQDERRYTGQTGR